MDLSVWGVTEEQIKEFRDWLNKQEHLPDVPDEYLARFLHSCYFNLEKAKKALDSYMKLKTKAPELFSNRNLDGEQMQKNIENCYLGILPTTTSKGYSVIWGRLMTPDSSKFSTEEGLKAMYLTVDRLLLERKGCPGIIFVYDTDNFTIRHIFKTAISTIRNYFEYIQEAVPMRHKTIHLINVGSITTYLMAAIRPFVYKEHLKKIHFHPSNNIDGLLEDIPKEQIPSDYGGCGPSLRKISDDNCNSIRSHSDWFKFDETLKMKDMKKFK
ncbi:alpha-tocopherol transfer protein isoform X2 [Halyomorpha halys]|uniref:alpha-tocopherol transfer protein isoform X2 n=1 Tax=Halyomorpha halys TaxID=286706 RepID=UPI0006D51D37